MYKCVCLKLDAYSDEVNGHFDFGNFPTFSNPPARGDGVQGPAIPRLGRRHDGTRYLIYDHLITSLQFSAALQTT